MAGLFMALHPRTKRDDLRAILKKMGEHVDIATGTLSQVRFLDALLEGEELLAERQRLRGDASTPRGNQVGPTGEDEPLKPSGSASRSGRSGVLGKLSLRKRAGAFAPAIPSWTSVEDDIATKSEGLAGSIAQARSKMGESVQSVSATATSAAECASSSVAAAAQSTADLGEQSLSPSRLVPSAATKHCI